MGTLATAPGVIKAVTVTYVTVVDVMRLLGCKENKAYQSIREVNKFAEDKGLFAYVQGKASKYIFAEKYGIPMEVVDAIIEDNRIQN